VADKLARALGLFFSFPFEGARDVQGVYQRVRLLMASLAAVSSGVDLLFYVPADSPVEGGPIDEARADLADLLKVSVNLVLCRRRPGAPVEATRRAHLTRTFIPGLFNVRRQGLHASFCGPEQVAALGACLARRPEVILAHDLRTMLPVQEWRGPMAPVVFDVDNIEHRLRLRHLLRSPRWPGERLRLAWLPAMFLAEVRACRRARRVFVCSETDQRYLRRLGIRHASVVPNAVQVPDTIPTQSGPPRVLFVGRLDYQPNASAAEYLVSEIWPKVHTNMPEAELWIAGTPPDAVRGSQAPPAGVRFLGFVEDLDRLYANVRVVTGPIHVGGGTRFKLIEAAAHGKAIVSTTVGAEGLRLEPEREILLRDKPEAFATACIDLLRDDARALELGRRAQERARLCYSRPVVVEAIAQELHSVAGGDDGRALR
jgi:glycosyltransferase involved in cell wall biosynthesis